MIVFIIKIIVNFWILLYITQNMQMDWYSIATDNFGWHLLIGDIIAPKG